MEFIKDNPMLTIGDKLKIDYTDCKLLEYDYLGDFIDVFTITPLDYLAFAKESFLLNSNKGLIDALSNAKRAIDCQIDSIISVLGYDYKKFDERNSYKFTKQFIKSFYVGKTSIGLTEKIKLLNVLNIMPTLLISKNRNLRNIIEHEYVIPKNEEVQEAIEIAELFIYSSNKKISDTNRSIIFGSNYFIEERERVDRTTYQFTRMKPKYVCIEYNIHKKFNFDIVIVNEDEKIFPYNSFSTKNEEYYIDSSMESYPFLLKVLFDKAYYLIPQILGNNMKEEFISFKIEHA